MRIFVATLLAVGSLGALAACETAGDQYDGVSRFAEAPFYGPGSPPREEFPPAPPLPDIPGQPQQS